MAWKQVPVHAVSVLFAFCILAALGYSNWNRDFNSRTFKLTKGSEVYLQKFNAVPQTFFVDSSASGLNNGTSWIDAFTLLQSALDIANSCDTIKVAQGTYYPDEGSGYMNNSRDSSFNIPDSVVLLGGYPGGGGNDRNWVCNKTILCGEIQQDADATNNSEHVVVTRNADSFLIVDGFYIVDGFNEENQLVNGGGAGWLNDGSGIGNRSNPTIRNCTFSINEANFGGGLFNNGYLGEASPRLINCIFNANYSNNFAGGVYNHGADGLSSPIFINCIFSGNLAESVGGALVNDGGGTNGESNPRLINCVLNGNSALQFGGAIYNLGGADCLPILINCIIWNNSTSVIAENGSTTTISYSIVQTGVTYTNGGNNKPDGTDPLFILAPDNTMAPTIAGDFHLNFSSPAIDMGLDMANPTSFDLVGKSRIQNDSIDLGAYEFQGQGPECNLFSSGTVYVDSAATSGANNGTSWINAYTDLQDGLLAARFCDQVDTIKVAQGTYYPSDSVFTTDPCDNLISAIPPDRNISFDIPDSIKLIGGYYGILGEMDSSRRDYLCHKTILCGEIQQNSDNSDNSYHVVTTFNVDSLTLIDGFIIRDGNANIMSYPVNTGGGWFNSGVSFPVIRNCIITRNRAFRGGGMANDGNMGNASPILINTIFSANTAFGAGGGGVHSTGSNGISNPRFINCLITGNQAVDGGGVANTALGGGVCNALFINCVLNGNTASGSGGGIYNESANSTLINCITWNNSTAFGGTGTVTASYSINQIGASYTNGGNNKTNGTNPLFINAPVAIDAPTALGDFHVIQNSPAIHMGLDTANTYPSDLDGNDRVWGDRIDIGAYEFQGPDCNLFNLGIAYVDSAATAGANNGTSWVNAYTDLQDALFAARFCDQIDTIKVAQGTYYPSDSVVIYDQCTSNPVDTLLPARDLSFVIPDSVKLLGGYLAGTETREFECYPTILCGEIQQDNDKTNNSQHVLVTGEVSDATVVDGFWIRGGFANDLDGSANDDDRGGGWLNYGNPQILNCIFIENCAEALGGALYNYSASPYIFNCRFIRNRAESEGNGQGGAMHNDGADDRISSPRIFNCFFTENYAFIFGGAIFNIGSSGTSSPEIFNTVFDSNIAGFKGGAMYSDGSFGISHAKLYNTAFYNNQAPQGSAIHIFTGLGGGMSIVDLYNSIVFSNSVPSISTENAAFLNSFNNLIDIDPLFVDAPGGDFHVLAGSPAIDMGTAVPQTIDLDQLPRFQGSAIDIGPYETEGPECGLLTGEVVYVDSSATGENNGNSWVDAFTDLQDALSAVAYCGIDTIKVAQGTYYPSGPDTLFDQCDPEIFMVIPADRTVSFDILDSTVVLGGYARGGSDFRDSKCNKTILSGEIQQDSDNSNNSYHVVTTTNVSSATLIDGFCITDGYADGTEFPDYVGAGWYNDGSGEGNESSPTIVNCVLTGNFAGTGGGMYNTGGVLGNSSPILINCIISSNIASNGAGLFNDAITGTSNPVLTNCIISGNWSDSGGGLFNSGFEGTCNPVLINCVLSGNSAILEAGGMYNSDASPTMVNCITWNNSTAFEGFGTFSITISYSIIQAGAVFSDGGNNKPDVTDPLFIYAPSFTEAPTAAGDFHVMDGSPTINMGEVPSTSNTYSSDLDGMSRIAEGIIDIGPYEKLIRCDIDTLFVLADGSIPSLPLDSILRDTLPEGFVLLVNGLSYEDDDNILFTCENLNTNNLEVLLIRNCDTIDGCTKIVFLIDTFEKNLICNDLVNISLGAGCLKLVTTDDVLENAMGCREVLYDINLVYPFGTHKFPPANDLLDASHIGYTMVYNAIETLTGNSCWGYLKVEDKLPPLLNCADDTIACYELPTLPLIASNEDDCYDGKVELVSDEWFDYGCDSLLSGYVIRTIQGTDRWGNFRRCESIISIERTELDSLVCPDLVELPCEIKYQIGGVIIHALNLKTPIVVDQTKITPEFLLSLQKPIWDLIDPIDQTPSKGWVLNPAVQVVPQVDGQNIYPGAGGICKINSLFKDTRLDVCGAGFKIYREWIITDWCTQEERVCAQYITVEDKEVPELLTELNVLEYNASAHDCIAAVTIPALVPGKDFRDCNLVDQTYILQYDDPSHPGKIKVLTGTLPSVKINLPRGEYTIDITLIDKCQNRTTTSRDIYIYDITPPTPVCDEYTQVTVDPVSCWARIAAKDLDNGSRDNCCDILHFAAANMDSIIYWRNYWNTRLETKVGKADFWRDKATYDLMIEDWINCYVFSDSIQLTECGTAQVVLRVYEACGVPRMDPHIWTCSEHAWFCYNTYLYIADFNFNWFDDKGPHSCTYRPELTSIATQDSIYADYKIKGYLEPKFEGAAQFLFCNAPFYFPTLGNSSGGSLVPGTYCSLKQYNDCMINILVDDKQSPVVAELEDVLVYCDRAPDYASRPQCEGGDEYLIWPGLLKDSKGVEHGYYGGSDFLGIHRDEHETADACGYDNVHHWTPIYCRSWLYVDSFDAAGQIDPKQYFETIVLFDKTRPARTLLAKEFSITDNCRLNDTTLKVTDEGSLNGCGEGWIQRTWTIKDKCDNPITVRQKVVVKHRSDFEVIFPEDKVVECDFLNTTDPKDAGEPIISDDECEQVGVQYKDEVFTVEDSACYKIVRTWTLIDWCKYNPNADRHYSDVIVDDRLRADTGNRSCVYRHLKDNNDGYMKYIQVIKVIDKVAPVVTTRDTTICIYGEDCKSTLVRIPFSGTDNCTATVELSYRVEVDLNATDGVFTNRTYVKNSIDLSTQSNPTEFVYSPSVAGKHVVHVIVKDNCGNEDTSSYRFELKDCKKPTPYCYNGIATVIMPSTGKITVWAKDLDAGSFDNCTLTDKLKFSFSSNSTESSKEFSCTDIPDGKSKTIPVEIWVTDEAGNQDHCTTYILLQDNSGNACPDVAGLSVTIAGTIQTETKEPVEHVRVNIYGGAVQMNYQTGVKGTYHFEGLASKSNYSIKSTRNDQPMNGVSTLDLVLIQKHILGIELLDSPYKVLAADIDNDKQITAIDLVELRKLILASYEALPNNESWRFIPKSTSFVDIQNPWNAGPISAVMEMKEVTTDYKSGDFIGIKVGDVNASVTPHSLMGVEVRGNETGLIFEINDQNFKRSDLVRVDFRSPNFRGISGWQGTLSATSSELRAASSLNLIELIPGKLNLSNQNIGLRHAQEGMITMSWNTNAKSGLDIDDQQVLFTLVFKAQENGRLSEVLRIGSQHTIAESYEGKGELGNLGIRFVQNGSEIVAKSELYQNYPNPFDQRTVIGINLANQGKGTLKVFDATGRTIKSVERDWTKGYHEVWFDRKEIGATGVLYYRFESGFFTASKKMILID